MRKTLALLTFSLLLLTAMIFNVSATISESDVGFYIRFDSQAKIDLHIRTGSYVNNIAFDDKEVAMRYSPDIVATNVDNQLHVDLQTNIVDVTTYPYMRITYKYPTVGINGKTTYDYSGSYVFFNASGTAAMDFELKRADAKQTVVVDCTSIAGKDDPKSLRLDTPNIYTPAFTGKEPYFEYYIYDIGFFKTEDAAKNYDPAKAEINEALANQDAPMGITAVAPTKKGGNGKLSGVTTDMEYRESVSGAYEAVAIDKDATNVMTVESGKTYYVRYKATAEKNASDAVAVTVPRYWKFAITAIKYGDGELTGDFTITSNGMDWTITVPYNVDLAKLKPIYTLDSDTPTKYENILNPQITRAAAALYANGDYTSSSDDTIKASKARQKISSDSAFGSGIAEGKNQLHIYQPLSIYEVVNVEIKRAAEPQDDLIKNVGNKILDTIRTVDGEKAVPTNYAHYVLLAKNQATVATAIETVAKKFAARYTDIEFVSVDVTNFTDSKPGNATNKTGTDGSCNVAIKLKNTSTDAEETFNITNLKIPAAHYRIIFDFGDPIVQNAVSPYNKDKMTAEFINDSNTFGGARMKLSRVNDSTTNDKSEFNFVLNFNEKNGLPTIDQLADYQVIVYKAKNSVKLNYQIFYYTDAKKSGDPNQMVGDTNTAGNWGIFKFKTGANNGTDADHIWGGKVSKLRFDFMRYSQDLNRTTELEYIALFATEADANEFIANQTKTEEKQIELLGAQIRANNEEVALRFGAKVNVGANALVSAVTADKNTYTELAPTSVLTDLKFGMLIVPKTALDDKELTIENLTKENDKYYIGEGEDKVEVAVVACNNIYDAKADSFIYTAVVTDIGENTGVELVARPYITYKIGNTTLYKYYDAITRSYNGVATKLGENKLTNWDK